MLEVKVWDGVPVEHRRMGRLEGFFPALAEEISDAEKKITWHDAKIKPWLWKAIKSFMIWSQQQFNSEAQLRLYYNDRMNRWRAMAMPQYIGTGLFSAEIPNHKNREELNQYLLESKGWYEYGTVHHHCTASAFQSGTDHKDEKDRPGLHITLGHILSDKLDIHARFVKPNGKRQYTVDLTEWIDGTMEEITATTTANFPHLWCDQCFKKPVQTYKPVQGYLQNWQQKPGMYGSDWANSPGALRHYDTAFEPDYDNAPEGMEFCFDLDMHLPDYLVRLYELWDSEIGLSQYTYAHTAEDIVERIKGFKEALETANDILDTVLGYSSDDVMPVLVLMEELVKTRLDVDLDLLPAVEDAFTAGLAEMTEKETNADDNAVLMADSFRS